MAHGGLWAQGPTLWVELGVIPLRPKQSEYQGQWGGTRLLHVSCGTGPACQEPWVCWEPRVPSSALRGVAGAGAAPSAACPQDSLTSARGLFTQLPAAPSLTPWPFHPAGVLLPGPASLHLSGFALLAPAAPGDASGRHNQPAQHQGPNPGGWKRHDGPGLRLLGIKIIPPSRACIPTQADQG